MNLTDEQKDLLRKMVTVYDSGDTSEFVVIRLYEESRLLYNSESVLITADDGDFYQLAQEKLMTLSPGRSSGDLRGKLTRLGIESVRTDFSAPVQRGSGSIIGPRDSDAKSFPDATGAATPASSLNDTRQPRVKGPNLEALIEQREYVAIPIAARYLELSVGHVRKLVSGGRLIRLGQGRPIRVSTESLRKYKLA